MGVSDRTLNMCTSLSMLFVRKVKEFCRDVQNTQKDHPTIKRMFIKKFGAHNVKHFDRHVSALVDQYDPEAKKMVK